MSKKQKRVDVEEAIQDLMGSLGDWMEIAEEGDQRDSDDEAITGGEQAIAQVKAMRETIKTLADYLEEEHRIEVERNHHGDKYPCSYCEAIKKARAIQAPID